MATLPRSLFWARTDTAGSEHVVLDDRRGLTARGVAQATDPLPYTCRYELATDPGWATTRLVVEVEGAGWSRSVRMERAGDRWRVGTAESGDLDAALRVAGRPGAGLPGTDEPHRIEDAVDVDLSASALFNTLPVRRLGLVGAEAGTTRRITAAWVQVPSLLVAPLDEVYTALGDGSVRFASDGFTADLTLDASGYVLRYPGLVERPVAG